MTEMMFSEFNNLKAKILDLADAAKNDGILSDQDLNEIKGVLQKEKIRVGICGQVKTGKSTFINGLLFGEIILPVGSTPMTASLCCLTFGNKKCEVEFFTKDEWNDIEKLANTTNGDDEKAKAAKEYIEQSKAIRNEILNLLGKRLEVGLEELSKYVGSEGKYTPIVKSLKILLPDDILKSVELVDTPGVNDPVISREHTTLKFLKEADVVFLFCYAGRPFDEADKDFLRKVKNSAGKVIIIINKKDMILSEEKGEEKVLERFKEQIQELIKETDKEKGSKYVIDMLEKAKDRIVIFSSLWALIGKMTENNIYKDDDISYYYQKFKEEFPFLKTPDDFLENSGLSDIEKNLRELLKEKNNILINKSIYFIEKGYKTFITNLKKESDAYKSEIKAYDYKLEEIDKDIKSLDSIHKSLEYVILPTHNIELRKKINERYDDIKKQSNSKIKKLHQEITQKIPQKGFFQRHVSYQSACEGIFDNKMSEGKYDIKDELNELTKALRKYVEAECEKIFNEIIKLGTNLLIVKKDLDAVLKEISNEIKYELQIHIPSAKFETKGLWIDARAEVLKQISKAIDEYNNNVNQEIDRIIQGAEGVYRKASADLKNQTFTKIKEPLERARQNYHDQKNRKNELSKKLNELTQKITSVEEKFELMIKEINQMNM